MTEKNITENDDEDDEDESVCPLGCLIMAGVMGLIGFIGYGGCVQDRQEQEQNLQKIVLTQSQDIYIRGEIIDESYVPAETKKFWTPSESENYLVKIKSNTREYSLDLRPTKGLDLKLLDLNFNKGDKVKFPKYFNAKEAGYDSEARRLGISPESYVNIERFPNKSGMLDGDLLLKDTN